MTLRSLINSVQSSLSKAGSSATAPHLALGARGEAAAAKHLQEQGYKILVRNFRGYSGELDIIARHDDTLVFVEVKTRRSEQIAAPHEQVNLKKQKHIAKVGFEYLRQLKDHQVKIRFDIVEVILKAGELEPSIIRVFPSAFECPSPYFY